MALQPEGPDPFAEVAEVLLSRKLALRFHRSAMAMGFFSVLLSLFFSNGIHCGQN